MYYKITNQESEVYKKLHAMRTQELAWEDENEKKIEEKTGLTWTVFLGRRGQQSFSRVTEYSGFIFDQPEKVDPKVWAPHKTEEGGFVPNRRTKAGREMAKFLSREMGGHWFNIVFVNIGMEPPNGRFSFPFVEICGEVIILFLDENHIPSNEDIIEITKTEFEQIRQKQVNKNH